MRDFARGGLVVFECSQRREVIEWLVGDCRHADGAGRRSEGGVGHHQVGECLTAWIARREVLGHGQGFAPRRRASE